MITTMMGVIIVIIILVLLIILLLKMTKVYHIIWYWCQDIWDSYMVEEGQKIRARPPPQASFSGRKRPLLMQCHWVGDGIGYEALVINFRWKWKWAKTCPSSVPQLGEMKRNINSSSHQRKKQAMSPCAMHNVHPPGDLCRKNGNGNGKVDN